MDATIVKTEPETFTDNNGDTWREVFSVYVPGLPQPGGSKRGFFIKSIGRVVITDANKKARSWKDTVATFAADQWKGKPLIDAAMFVKCIFYMPRPKAHFRTGKRANELRPDATKFHTKKPDGTKLFRSTEDALTNVIWTDDAKVVDQFVRKRFSESPGAMVTVYVLYTPEVDELL